MNEVILAVVLLSMETDDTTKYNHYDTPIMRLAVCEVAVKMELWDKAARSGSVWNHYAGKDVFSPVIRDLQERHSWLKNTPHLEEANRFPNLKVAHEFLITNRNYREHLVQLRALAPPWQLNQIDAAISDTDQLYAVWLYVSEAQNTLSCIKSRRLALADVRRAVGMREFYSGELPPPVPIWYIPRDR